LIAQRTPVRRHSIRQALQSDDFSCENLRDSLKLGAFRAAQDEPPRTSARRRGGEKGKYGERPSFSPSVSATKQPRNVKVDFSAGKSKRKPVAPAVPLDRSTEHGAFGAAAAAGSSRTVEAGATMGLQKTLKKAEVTTEPFPNRLQVRKFPENR